MSKEKDQETLNNYKNTGDPKGKKAQKENKIEHIPGDSVIHHTALSGQKGTLEKLLSHGMRAEHQSSYDGATPLHRAAQVGNKVIAQVLLNHGAQMNSPNFLGQTPVHIALEKKHIDFARFLINKGARRRCKHNCMRCQTFNDTLQKEYHGKQIKKSRYHRTQKRENPLDNPIEITHDQAQDHLVVESEQNLQNSNGPTEPKGPELICKDFSELNIDKILAKKSKHETNSNSSLDSVNLSEEIK